MRSFVLYALVALSNILAVTSGLAISLNDTQMRDEDVRLHNSDTSNPHAPRADIHLNLDRRSGNFPLKSQPIKPPRNAKPPMKPKPAPKPAPKPMPSKPTSRSATAQPASSATPVSPLKPDKLLPFTKEPRPTQAFDICDLPGFDCTDDGEGVPEGLAQRHVEGAHAFEAADIWKRSSPRTYSVVPGGGTPTMMMTSLPYPLESKLFPAGSPKVILDFGTDHVRDASFKAFSSPPERTDPNTYIVEHIVELQTIKLFLNAAVQVGIKTGVKKLSEKVDMSFFTKHWGTSNAQVQQKIAMRPNPFPGYNPSAARSSLNDLVFEALGSKTNTADFVLCEEGVNAMKAKLWSHIQPFGLKQWQAIAKDAADGSIPRNRHLAALRSVLGVYNYINTPQVTKRLQESIKNVKIEFGNFKAITGEDVKNTSGKPVDLPALWVEFMTAQLKTFTAGGTEYIKTQVNYALPLYKKHLSDLQQVSKRLRDEDAAKQTPQGKVALDRRIQAHNTLVQSLPAIKLTLSQSETRLDTAKKAYEAANAALKMATPANKSKLLLDKRSASNAKKLAVVSHYKALVAKGRHEEDIIKLRPADLTALIRDLEADIKQMTDYSAAAAAMKVPKAE